MELAFINSMAFSTVVCADTVMGLGTINDLIFTEKTFSRRRLKQYIKL